MSLHYLVEASHMQSGVLHLALHHRPMSAGSLILQPVQFLKEFGDRIQHRQTSRPALTRSANLRIQPKKYIVRTEPNALICISNKQSHCFVSANRKNLPYCKRAEMLFVLTVNFKLGTSHSSNETTARNRKYLFLLLTETSDIRLSLSFKGNNAPHWFSS
uniref:Uncharacterized protein n=1 Tax=Parascaris univalens TaxID=6257 RepID=A0A915BSD0_PARUN